MKYKHAILGGTFDHLHKGHEFFISQAFENADQVTIGLTTDKFSEGKEFSYAIQKYEDRKESLNKFLNEKEFTPRAKIIEINDPYGTSIDDENINALFVTDHGVAAAREINGKRVDKGFSELAINHVDFVKGPDGEVISSTRIRRGEIDTEGNPYSSLFEKDLSMPEGLREDLRVLGEVFPDVASLTEKLLATKFIITVGDVVTTSFLASGISVNVGILDLSTQRGEFEESAALDVNFEVENPAGTIASQAATVVSQAISKALEVNATQIIKVNGEEDLLTLTAIMLSPLKSVVLYGLPPDKGIVAVDVNETKKEEIKTLIGKFIHQQ